MNDYEVFATLFNMMPDAVKEDFLNFSAQIDGIKEEFGLSEEEAVEWMSRNYESSEESKLCWSQEVKDFFSNIMEEYYES